MTRIRILVVEDERVVSEDIKITLTKSGYDVLAIVSSGESAVQKALRLRPDIILMDIVLRGEMTGIEAAEKIRSQINIPIIYLTAYADEPTLMRAQKTEPFGYIVKPFEERELNTAIEIALYRNELEQKLRENEQRIATILNSIDDAVIATDIHFKITFINPVAEKITGLSFDDTLHRHFTEVFCLTQKAERETITNYLKDIKKNKNTERCRFKGSTLLSNDQLKVPVEGSLTPIYDKSEQILGVVLVFRDISERTQAEQTIQESEKKYRELVENINDILYTTDETGVITYISSAIEAVSGYKPSEVIGHSFLEFVSSVDENRINFDFKKITQPDTLPREYRFLTKDNQNKWFRSSCRPIFSKDKFIGLRGVLTDISARKDAEAEINKLTQFLNLVIESANIWLQAVDETGNVVLWNDAAERISGYSRDEVLGNDHYIDWLFPNPQNRNELKLKIDDIISGKQIVADFESVIIARDNQPKTISWHARNLQNDRGDSIGAVALGRDITAQQQLEEQLRQSHKMEAVGRLAGGVAHDFNNLLTAIIGNTELMLFQPALSDRMRTDLNEVKNAAERAAALTRQLLAFSRKQPLQPTILDLNGVILNMQRLLTRLIEEDIKLITELAVNIDRIKGDASQIEQMIMNLVINARDAMPHGGKLTIKTENVTISEKDCKILPYARRGRFVQLTIQDSGIGMSKDMINRIFEPFYSTKSYGVGTGLGMSVVYGIVKQHTGWINVYSELDQGSTIIVYLPALIARQSPYIKKPVIQPLLQGNGEKILVVEDENAVLKLAKRALRENGYHIFSARNAEEAFQVFKEENGAFNLIFSDVVLPGKSGLEFIKELNSKYPGIKVLLCSGYTDEKSQWPLIKKKGIPFIEKPYKIPVLLKTIKELIHPVR